MSVQDLANLRHTQAKTRAADRSHQPKPSKPAKPGKVDKFEPNYKSVINTHENLIKNLDADLAAVRSIDPKVSQTTTISPSMFKYPVNSNASPKQRKAAQAQFAKAEKAADELNTRTQLSAAERMKRLNIVLRAIKRKKAFYNRIIKAATRAQTDARYLNKMPEDLRLLLGVQAAQTGDHPSQRRSKPAPAATSGEAKKDAEAIADL